MAEDFTVFLPQPGEDRRHPGVVPGLLLNPGQDIPAKAFLFGGGRVDAEDVPDAVLLLRVQLAEQASGLSQRETPGGHLGDDFVLARAEAHGGGRAPHEIFLPAGFPSEGGQVLEHHGVPAVGDEVGPAPGDEEEAGGEEYFVPTDRHSGGLP
jgi:hypothetical protein